MSIPTDREYPASVKTGFSEPCETFCALLVGPPDISMEPLGERFSLDSFQRLQAPHVEELIISPSRMKIMFREISQQFGSETVRYGVYWQHRYIEPGSSVELIFNNEVTSPKLFNVIIFGFTDKDTYSTQTKSYTDLFPSKIKT